MRLKQLFENNEVHWVKAPFEAEVGEFQRYTLIPRKLDNIKRRYEAAPIVPLDDETWSQLENTESYGVTTKAGLRLGMAQDRAFSDIHPDIARIADQFKRGKVACPIIMKIGGELELVAGNTRLTIARLLGITPRVVML